MLNPMLSQLCLTLVYHMEPLAATLFGIGGKLIDKVFPDPEEKAKAQLELLRMQQAGELEEIKQSLSAIIAEAQSADPWTSRARPSFLYVMYIMILFSLVMGLFYIADANKAQAMIEGTKLWLAAIPEQMWTLFGVGYLGYTGMRAWEKKKG